ncbi:VanZ family protein [Candidatus Woesebacteria bacterium]|nr:VanZ family protein [Candidatus Woesebacteria bacterium]
MIKKIIYWAPPLIWMGIIFYLSSKPQFTATGEILEDFLIFKTLHMAEYGLLALLLFNALYNTVTQNFYNAIRLSWVFSVLYGASDELHQIFIPTRGGTPRDVFIDALGITLVLYIIYHTRQRPASKKRM